MIALLYDYFQWPHPSLYVGSQKLDDGMELKTAFITVPCVENTVFPGFVISGRCGVININ